MLAKVIACGADRAAALRGLDAALADTVVLGVATNVGFLRALLADPDVVAGRLDTGLVGPPGRRLRAGAGAARRRVRRGRGVPLARSGGQARPTTRGHVPGGWRVGDAGLDA